MGGSIYSTGNVIVDEYAKLSITGNIIPQMWYRTIVRDSGKPNLTAIVILADICQEKIQVGFIAAKLSANKRAVWDI